MIHPQVLAILAALSATVVNCLAQKDAELKPEAEKPGTVEALTEAQLKKLLNARLEGGLQFSFQQFANMFLVSSRIEFGTAVGLMTESERIAESELQSIYPANYRPTLRQFLDRIALQASATWTYDPTGKFVRDTTGANKAVQDLAIFEFGERKKVTKPYEITNRTNKTALTNPLPLWSRSWRVQGNPRQNRRCAPSSGWQAFDALLKNYPA